MNDIIDFNGTMDVVEAYDFRQGGEFINDSLMTNFVVVIIRCHLYAANNTISVNGILQIACNYVENPPFLSFYEGSNMSEKY